MTHPDRDALQLFVNRLLARSVLSDEEQDAILALPTVTHRIKARQDFVRPNEQINYVCLIATGMAGRFGQTKDGARQITAFHIPGDMADLHSAVRPIGVGGLYALCDTTILRISHIAIRTLAARYPAIAEAFWRDCMVDAAVLMQWVVNVGRRDSRTRIAHLLCEMASRSGNDRTFVQDYAFPVTQEQIGEAAGLSTVHVNRVLKTLGDLATVRSGRVMIHDWAQLAFAGDFDAGYLVASTGDERQRHLFALPLAEWSAG